MYGDTNPFWFGVDCWDAWDRTTLVGRILFVLTWRRWVKTWAPREAYEVEWTGFWGQLGFIVLPCFSAKDRVLHYGLSVCGRAQLIADGAGGRCRGRLNLDGGTCPETP